MMVKHKLCHPRTGGRLETSDIHINPASIDWVEPTCDGCAVGIRGQVFSILAHEEEVLEQIEVATADMYIVNTDDLMQKHLGCVRVARK